MIILSVQQNIDQAIAGLSDFQKNQVPFATALALNEVATLAKSSIQAEMNVIFDKPTPYTINSIRVIRASKTNLTAFVGSKDASPGVTPASAYLKYEILGGNRAEKSTEKAAGSIFVPTKSAKLNQYGNLPSVIVAAIRAAIQSGAGSFVSGNQKFVVMRAGNPRGLTPGVYVTGASNLSTKISGRKGSKVATTRGTGPLKPIVFFESKASYKPRYDMEAIVNRIVKADFDKEFEAALAHALLTAK